MTEKSEDGRSSQPSEVTDWTEDDETIERRTLETAINDAKERLAFKADQRRLNHKDNIKYPEESFFFKLDSSIKKNSAFVKKLKNLTESQRESILKDMSGLNLSKYISEVASALVDAKIKMSDINLSLKVATEMNQRYPEFSSILLDTWIKSFPKKATDFPSINASKLRIDVRLFAELITCGIFTPKEGLTPLGSLLKLLTTEDKENHANLAVILSFCKNCADDYLGLIPRKIRLLSEKYGETVPKSDFMTSERQKQVNQLMKDYYKSLVTHVLRDHKSLQNQERSNRRALLTRGELSNDRKEKFEADQLAFNKLFSLAQQLADCLDEDEPILPPTPPDLLEDPLDSLNVDTTNRFKTNVDFDPLSFWEDEDIKTFYESLPDIAALIPSICFKDSQKDGKKEKEMNEVTEMKGNEIDEELDIEKEFESSNVIPELLLEDDPNEDGDEEESKDGDSISSSTPLPKVDKASNKVMLDAFLNSLSTCVNRDMIDKAAIHFCTNLNTKFNRKKLVRALFTVQRTRLDLLPFYSRLVKSLQPVMPHVADDLVQLLKTDFRFHVKKKDQINIESKIKNVRFIGELVKFNIFPKNEVILCLRMLLHDFTHHQIEMACNLLETCGRYLHRSTETHHKLNLLLEQMMRKKALLYDPRYITMIENAYYATNPDECKATIPKVERPPLHTYVRHLLYVELNRSNVDKVLKQLRKFNWYDRDTASYIIRCFFAVWNVKFPTIRFLANLLAGLERYQDWVVPRVVDSVLEDVRLMMEVNLPKFNQRRISMVKYLGEMYNYRLVDSSVIFKELYSFITFGVYYDHPEIPSELDPPDNLFRLRLICQLLDTCAPYFVSASSKRKLDCFFLYFQRYYWFKRENKYWSDIEGLTNGHDGNKFPVTIQHLVHDCLAQLRPKFKMSKSYEESHTLVEKLINDLKPKVLELYPSLQDSSNPEKVVVGGDLKNGSNDSLNAIPEELEDVLSEPIADDRIIFREEDEDMISQTSESRENSLEDDEGQTQTTQSQDEMSSPNFLGDEDIDLGSNAPRHVTCTEDDDFLKDFDKLMSESIMSRGNESRGPALANLYIPSDVDTSSSRPPVRKTKFIPFDDHYSSDDDDEEPQPKNTINLMLMTRPTKGNKPVLKSVEVSVDTDLAQSIMMKEELERNEKAKLKKLTLDITERLEDSEISVSPQVTNFNREQKKKYQHQKGAPDADLIFGSSSSTTTASASPMINLGRHGDTKLDYPQLILHVETPSHKLSNLELGRPENEMKEDRFEEKCSSSDV